MKYFAVARSAPSHRLSPSACSGHKVLVWSKTYCPCELCWNGEGWRAHAVAVGKECGPKGDLPALDLLVCLLPDCVKAKRALAKFLPADKACATVFAAGSAEGSCSQAPRDMQKQTQAPDATDVCLRGGTARPRPTLPPLYFSC